VGWCAIGDMGFPSEALFYDQPWQKMHKGLGRKKNKGRKRAGWWAAKMALLDGDGGPWGIEGYTAAQVGAATQEVAKVVATALLSPSQNIGTTSKSGPRKGYSSPPYFMLPLAPPLLLPPPLQGDLTDLAPVDEEGGEGAGDGGHEVSPTSIVDSVLSDCSRLARL
jgi:hypothetical protein